MKTTVFQGLPRIMKTLVTLLFLLHGPSPFAQKLVVELYEKQDFFSNRITTIDSVLMYPDYVSEIANS
ncbi:MAG: hypothetical protein ACKO5L_00465, partial [Bacteroidota bacterium]